MKKLALFLFPIVFLSTSALAVQWVPSVPPKSCAEVCSGGAISSDKDKRGYNFFVCRGKARNGDLRPGFNIETSPDSSKQCLFEYGGDRGQSSSYDCLCK